MKQQGNSADSTARPWRDLPPVAQEMYLAIYRRSWEKCHAGGIEDRDQLAKAAHRAAVLGVQSEFELDGEARDIQSPTGAATAKTTSPRKNYKPVDVDGGESDSDNTVGQT